MQESMYKHIDYDTIRISCLRVQWLQHMLHASYREVVQGQILRLWVVKTQSEQQKAHWQGPTQGRSAKARDSVAEGLACTTCMSMTAFANKSHVASACLFVQMTVKVVKDASRLGKMGDPLTH